MSLRYAHVAARMFNRPLLFEAGKLEVIYGVLASRIGIEPPRAGADAPGDPADREPTPTPDTPPADDADPQDRVQVINITGSLVNRIAMEPLSSFSSYERLRGKLLAAASDGKVNGILLRIESYGGEVAGVWDLADVIRQVGAQKPVWASIDDNAFSAAYAAASQAQRIYVTRTAGVGSVGVIALHWDYSEWLKNEGIKPMAIFAGAHKVDFAPWQPLPEGAAEWLRASVDKEYGRFIEYVAGGRKMDAAAVRKTQAALYEGQDGIDIGFADALGTFDQALGEFAAELRGKAGKTGGKAAQEGRGGRMEFTHTLADVDAAKKAGLTEGGVEGRKAERARFAAVLGCEEAKGRGKLALSLASETELDADQAKKILASAPLEQVAGDALSTAMAGVANPNVGAGNGDGADETAEAKATVAAYRAAMGVK